MFLPAPLMLCDSVIQKEFFVHVRSRVSFRRISPSAHVLAPTSEIWFEMKSYVSCVLCRVVWSVHGISEDIASIFSVES